MRPIPEGTEGVFTLTVASQHLANQFKDAALPPVLATPVMIMMMENAALNAIKPYLDAGESAVGTHVDVHHLAATPVGKRVTATARVKRASGRHVEFDVWAVDGSEEIGKGTHARAVIEMAKFLDRLGAKR
jgi:fluoroacetyl-CoA thioesterase